jgi:hypothetical protein
MSAPVGWYPEPDGRERFWDGTQWTDQFRMPPTPEAVQVSDPTPPPPPSWVTDDRTQVIGLDQTSALPAVPARPDPSAATYPADPHPADPRAGGPYPGGSYPAGSEPSVPIGPPLPASGYGSAGGGWQPPPQKRSGRGCLIAALVTLVVVALVAAVAIVAAIRAGREVVRTIESATAIPTAVPPGIPTTLPSGLPTALPTPRPTRVEVRPGEGFDLGRAKVRAGWRVAELAGIGGRIEGMTAELRGPDPVPLFFTMSFEKPGDDPVQTACTSAVSDAKGAVVDLTCSPLVGSVEGVEKVVVSSSF